MSLVISTVGLASVLLLCSLIIAIKISVIAILARDRARIKRELISKRNTTKQPTYEEINNTVHDLAAKRNIAYC